MVLTETYDSLTSKTDVWEVVFRRGGESVCKVQRSRTCIVTGGIRGVSQFIGNYVSLEVFTVEGFRFVRSVLGSSEDIGRVWSSRPGSEESPMDVRSPFYVFFKT